MALLDSNQSQNLGSLGGGVAPQQLMQLLQTGRQDPFARPLPGAGLLGDGGMSMPQPPGLETINSPQAGMGGPQIPGMNTISTSFADTQPGLPNLPDSFLGFGYGQFAPKEVQTGQGGAGGMPGGMRNDYIMQMLAQLLPSLQAGGGM